MALWFSLFYGSAILAAASPLIREEKGIKEVEIGSHGFKSFSHVDVKGSHGNTEKDMCNENYMAGAALSVADPTGCALLVGGATAIHDATMCSDCASVMGKSRGSGVSQPFATVAKIDNTNNKDERDDFPDGCFEKNAAPGALFINDLGGPALNGTQGTPMCTRPKYINATVDTNDGGCEEGGASDYTKILVEDECRTMAECTGYCHIEQFRVGVDAPSPSLDTRPEDTKAAFFDKRPEGCFIHPENGCVYFNVPKTDGTKPAGPITGTGVCKAASGHHGDNTAVTAKLAADKAAGTVGDTTEAAAEAKKTS